MGSEVLVSGQRVAASQPEQPQPQEVVSGWRQERQSRRPMKTTAPATAKKTS